MTKGLAQTATRVGGGWLRFAAAAGFVAAGCASPECPRWHEGGTLAQASTEEWVEASAENQLATAAFIAWLAFDFDDEYAWLAAASSIQGCINEVAFADSSAEYVQRHELSDWFTVCALGVSTEGLRGARVKSRDGAEP